MSDRLFFALVAGAWVGYVTSPLSLMALDALASRWHDWRHRNDPPLPPANLRAFEAGIKERYR